MCVCVCGPSEAPALSPNPPPHPPTLGHHCLFRTLVGQDSHTDIQGPTHEPQTAPGFLCTRQWVALRPEQRDCLARVILSRLCKWDGENPIALNAATRQDLPTLNGAARCVSVAGSALGSSHLFWGWAIHLLFCLRMGHSVIADAKMNYSARGGCSSCLCLSHQSSKSGHRRRELWLLAQVRRLNFSFRRKKKRPRWITQRLDSSPVSVSFLAWGEGWEARLLGELAAAQGLQGTRSESVCPCWSLG